MSVILTIITLKTFRVFRKVTLSIHFVPEQDVRSSWPFPVFEIVGKDGPTDRDKFKPIFSRLTNQSLGSQSPLWCASLWLPLPSTSSKILLWIPWRTPTLRLLPAIWWMEYRIGRSITKTMFCFVICCTLWVICMVNLSICLKAI